MSQWQPLLEHVPSSSLLISTASGTLIRFHCPIPVVCITAVAGYSKGDQLAIEGVFEINGELHYLFDHLKLPHHYFQLNI